jgi:hypothetical protein
MTNKESKVFIDTIFNKISNSNTISDLNKIADELKILKKNRMNLNDYPKIQFGISSAEIDYLISERIIDKDFNFIQNTISEIKDPLTKLLYATAWKNGDLKKIKHIIIGIKDGDKVNNNKTDGLVFHQFGKYLTKIKGQPIIDQHVLRAFSVYKTELVDDLDDLKITKLRKLESINKNHIYLINEYREWLNSDKLKNDLRVISDYSYHIDVLLFSAGKTIKKKS